MGSGEVTCGFENKGKKDFLLGGGRIKRLALPNAMCLLLLTLRAGASFFYVDTHEHLGYDQHYEK